MPKIPIKELLQMPKLLAERIKNGNVGDLLNLLRQLEELDDFNITDFVEMMNNISSSQVPSLLFENRDKLISYMIAGQIGYLMLQKSPKVDHREWDRMKDLMNSIGFQVVKIDSEGKEEGCELNVADYEQRLRDGKCVVVERKSDDFFSSIFDGRLFEQISNIIDNDNIICGFLIIDKSLTDLLSMARENNISENVVFGTIVSCCLKGFPPLFVGSVENFSKIVDILFFKAYDGKSRIFMPKLTVGKGEDIITFPGVDRVIGKRLYEHFGSIKAIVNADEKQLMEVKGVGKKIAEKIVRLCN